MLFSYYDRSGDGRLDYKEFANIFIEGGKTEADSRQSAGEQTRAYRMSKNMQESRQADSDGVNPEQLVKLFRDKLKGRGARGIVGIQRLFKIMDDDGSKSLSEHEFSKAIKDFKIGISEENIPILFNYFDSNRDGTLNIDEFLMAIRGELNDKRLAMVKQAFNKIDKDHSGYLEVEDIRSSYRADKHPDVINGKVSEETVIVEFLETFEAHLNMREGKSSDGVVTLEEFTEYYKNISVSIDNDDYFALMMNNSWNLKGEATPYQKYEKGWANEDASAGKKEQPQWLKPQQSLQRSGTMSADNPLSTTARYYKEQTSAGRVSNTANMSQG